MTKAFGHKFTVINSTFHPLLDLVNPINGKPYRTRSGRPFIHLASVRRGLIDYIAYLDEVENSVWIERIDPSNKWVLQRIENDNEWEDIYEFLLENKILEIGTRREIPITEEGSRLLGLT